MAIVTIPNVNRNNGVELLCVSSSSSAPSSSIPPEGAGLAMVSMRKVWMHCI